MRREPAAPDVRPGVTVEEAASILWTLTAFEISDRLVRRCGWTWDRYTDWLSTTTADALLP